MESRSINRHFLYHVASLLQLRLLGVLGVNVEIEIDSSYKRWRSPRDSQYPRSIFWLPISILCRDRII